MKRTLMRVLRFNNVNKKKYYFYAYFFDSLLWVYLLIILYRMGYQELFLSLEEASFLWGDLFLPLVWGLSLAFVLFFVPQCSLNREIFNIAKQSSKKTENHYSKLPYVWFLVALISATLFCGLRITQFSMTELFSFSGLIGVKRIFGALLTPNFSIIKEVIIAVIETFYIAFIATLFAIPYAFMMSFFSSSNLMRGSMIQKGTYFILRALLNITRSIEPLVWAIIFSVWVGIGPFGGMLALMLHSMAALSKLYSEQIENIEKGPQEMIASTGAHPIQVIWFGIVPQVIVPFLSFTIYRWDINLRMATIIGLVGGGGIGRMLIQYQGLAKWHNVGTIILVIACIVSLMDYFSMVVRKKINE
jgi:phosphonate transport system permease protein